MQKGETEGVKRGAEQEGIRWGGGRRFKDGKKRHNQTHLRGDKEIPKKSLPIAIDAILISSEMMRSDEMSTYREEEDD